MYGELNFLLKSSSSFSKKKKKGKMVILVNVLKPVLKFMLVSHTLKTESVKIGVRMFEDVISQQKQIRE